MTSSSDPAGAAGKVSLTVAYNGEPKDFDGPPGQPLRAVFNQALAKFGITGDDRQNQALFLDGNELDLDTKLGDLDLPEDAVLILQARRASGGGGDRPPLLVPLEVRAETEGHLRECGSEGWECAVLWAAPNDSHSSWTVERAYHPRHGRSRFGYDIAGEDLYRVHRSLLDEELKLVAQVHTHPGPAFHSERDDRGPAIHTPGFISVVVPNFARSGLGPSRGLYVTEYAGDGAWQELTPREQEERLQWEAGDGNR